MMNQSEFQAIILPITYPKCKGQNGFGVTSHWLRNWHKIFKTITKCSNHSGIIITFDSHFKTALTLTFTCS